MNDMEILPNDFRSLLQQELVKRCRKNPKYSLRAFAKALGIPSSALAEMLNGKRSITKKTIEKLGSKLGMELSVIENMKLAHGSRKDQDEIDQANFRQLTLDQYALISDWYHYAILELIKVRSFQNDNTWIAKALGITKSQANIALERLQRLGLLEINDSGEIEVSSIGFNTNISGNLTSTGARQLQGQILEQSLHALENFSIEKRSHTSMTMAINPSLIPEAKNRIAKFRRELCEFLESQGPQTEVYQMSLSLFPITSLEGEIQ